MKKLFISLFTIALFTSCGLGEQDQVVTIDQRYSLTIPAFLTKGDLLNDEASLQYQNLWKEFYVVVIDEPKADFQEILDLNEQTAFIDNPMELYAQYTFDLFKESLASTHQTDWVSKKVNDIPAILTTLTATHEGIEIFYNYGIFEGKETFYQVIVWTLNKSKSRYQPRMDQILHSLQEI